MQCFFVWIFIHLVVESLPLSSSGHIKLVEYIFQKNNDSLICFPIDPHTFSHLLHGITSIIIALFFFNRWFFALRYIVMRYKQKSYYSNHIVGSAIQLIIFIVIADTITALAYYVFNIYGTPPMPLAIGFLITAFILFLLSITMRKTTNEQLAYYNKRKYVCALIMGCAQAIALLPGISRLGSTYAATRWLGLNHRHGFELSFAIQWPLITGASIVALYKLISTHQIGQLLHMTVLLGMVIGGIVAWYALRLTDVMLKNNLSWIFGIYLMIVSIIGLLGYW